MVSPTGSFLGNFSLNTDADFGAEMHNLAVSLCPEDPSPVDLWNKAKPTMETRANLAVFMYELRDLKRMFEILPRKHFNLRNWKDVVKYGNDQHLNYMFGWRPFLSDLKKFYRGMSTFDSRLKSFIANANKDLNRHRSKSPVTQVLNKTFVLPYNSNWRASFDMTVTSVYAGAFRFSYDISEYSERELYWGSIADTLGAHINPANIWAIIPWSFVADWFVSIGPSLDQFSSSWVEPYVSVLQAYTSAKWTYQATLTLYPQGGFSGLPMVAGRISGSRYARRLGIPQFQMVYPDLNADKIRLLASLALSRIF